MRLTIGERIALTFAAILAAIALTITGGVAYALTLPPCATEDSVNCYWNADEQGNGQGRSFITLAIGDAEFVLYK